MERTADHSLSPDEARFVVDFGSYPYLTADVPGLGGEMRREVRDFQVTELAQPAAGEGEHLLLWIEKEDLTTRRVVEHLRDALGIPESEIGWAGLKDKRALTRQRISVPARFEAALAELPPLAGLTITHTERHTRKLQPGHLTGNRFRILLRDVTGDAESARALMERLAAGGVPNYFGPQRFGRFGDNAARGFRLLQTGRFKKYRWLDTFLVGSLQSFFFNEWVKKRMEGGTYDQVLLGDMAVKHDTGGAFHVEDAEKETPRAQVMGISASGPLFGRKYRESAHDARALEDELLQAFGMAREAFRALPGDRRALRVPLADWSVEPSPEGLWLAFSLPRGSFATAVLREVMKTEPEALAEGADE